MSHNWIGGLFYCVIADQDIFCITSGFEHFLYLRFCVVLMSGFDNIVFCLSLTLLIIWIIFMYIFHSQFYLVQFQLQYILCLFTVYAQVFHFGNILFYVYIFSLLLHNHTIGYIHVQYVLFYPWLNWSSFWGASYFHLLFVTYLFKGYECKYSFFKCIYCIESFSVNDCY